MFQSGFPLGVVNNNISDVLTEQTAKQPGIEESNYLSPLSLALFRGKKQNHCQIAEDLHGRIELSKTVEFICFHLIQKSYIFYFL